MAPSKTVTEFLDREGIDYRVLPHPATASSRDSALAAHVPEDHIAKAVVVQDPQGTAMVVIPASHWLRLDTLNSRLDRDFVLTPESVLDRLFPDCVSGAVPPVGVAYGMETLLDENLTSLARVFFEAGDHESLLEVSGDDFLKLQNGARRDYFSHNATS